MIAKGGKCPNCGHEYGGVDRGPLRQPGGVLPHRQGPLGLRDRRKNKQSANKLADYIQLYSQRKKMHEPLRARSRA